MILQALLSYYEALAERGEIAQLGWSPVKVSYALELNDAGEITHCFSLKQEVQNKKKTVLVPQVLNVPAPVKRTVGIASNFLCDNSAYILGIDSKGKPERAMDCFRACAERHHALLDTADEPAVQALLRFFDTWTAENFTAVIPDEERQKEILDGANLVFMYHGQYLHEIPSIRQIWQTNFSASEGEKYPCLITGQLAVPTQLHPSIKGIAGAQSSGASLVSFNAPAFCSYQREQGMNAPTSEYASFAYGTALNHLISTQRTRLGDTTILFWAQGGEEPYRTTMMFSLSGDVPEQYNAKDLQNVVNALVAGNTVEFEETLLDPNMNFYILGISPNAARLSVRFFLRNSFGAFLRNMQAHQERLEIVRPSFDSLSTIPLWKMLNETVNQNARDKAPSPLLAGDTLRAILTNTPYPATLLNGIQLRIRADRDINRIRAAIIKAYYLKKPHPHISKEVLQVSLNPNCTDTAYVLGRIFSVLEEIQNAANPSINTTIRDKYFSSASATPIAVFPTLINLAQKHLRKLSTPQKIALDKQLTELLGMLEQSYPTHLSLAQQGAFQLGYYHQTAFRYTKKEDK